MAIIDRQPLSPTPTSRPSLSSSTTKGWKSFTKSPILTQRPTLAAVSKGWKSFRDTSRRTLNSNTESSSDSSSSEDILLPTLKSCFKKKRRSSFDHLKCAVNQLSGQNSKKSVRFHNFDTGTYVLGLHEYSDEEFHATYLTPDELNKTVDKVTAIVEAEQRRKLQPGKTKGFMIRGLEKMMDHGEATYYWRQQGFAAVLRDGKYDPEDSDIELYRSISDHCLKEAIKFATKDAKFAKRHCCPQHQEGEEEEDTGDPSSSSVNLRSETPPTSSTCKDQQEHQQVSAGRTATGPKRTSQDMNRKPRTSKHDLLRQTQRPSGRTKRRDRPMKQLSEPTISQSNAAATLTSPPPRKQKSIPTIAKNTLFTIENLLFPSSPPLRNKPKLSVKAVLTKQQSEPTLLSTKFTLRTRRDTVQQQQEKVDVANTTAAETTETPVPSAASQPPNPNSIEPPQRRRTPPAPSGVQPKKKIASPPAVRKVSVGTSSPRATQTGKHGNKNVEQLLPCGGMIPPLESLKVKKSPTGRTKKRVSVASSSCKQQQWAGEGNSIPVSIDVPSSSKKKNDKDDADDMSLWTGAISHIKGDSSSANTTSKRTPRTPRTPRTKTKYHREKQNTTASSSSSSSSNRPTTISPAAA